MQLVTLINYLEHTRRPLGQFARAANEFYRGWREFWILCERMGILCALDGHQVGGVLCSLLILSVFFKELKDEIIIILEFIFVQMQNGENIEVAFVVVVMVASMPVAMRTCPTNQPTNQYSVVPVFQSAQCSLHWKAIEIDDLHQSGLLANFSSFSAL